MPGAAHRAKKPLTAITQHQPPRPLADHRGKFHLKLQCLCQGQRSPSPSLTGVPLPEHLQAVPLVQGAAAVHGAAHSLVQLQLPLEARVHPALRETEREGQGLRPAKGRGAAPPHPLLQPRHSLGIGLGRPDSSVRLLPAQPLRLHQVGGHHGHAAAHPGLAARERRRMRRGQPRGAASRAPVPVPTLTSGRGQPRRPPAPRR